MNFTPRTRLATASKSPANTAVVPLPQPASAHHAPAPRAAASSSILNVAFDVGSQSLNWSMELGGQAIDGECPNDSRAIRQTFRRILQQASQHGDYEIRVVCESTGVYHRRLLQLAHSLGMRTNLVHGEAVAKYRAIQFADHGKTDVRDPKATLTVARIGRLIKHRQFSSHYAQLRELHRLVLRCEARIKIAKCELHADLRDLFPDLRLDKSVLYGPSGRALIETFGGNPQAIVAAGWQTFSTQIKALSKHTKQATMRTIWRAAEDSVHARCDDASQAVALIQSRGVRQLYAEINEFSLRQRDLEQQMQAIYRQLQSIDRRLPDPQKGVVSLRLLARLVAEIGPPQDFHSVPQLLRYAGLNLCERRSGKWRGRTKISRRGRSELRYVLNLMAIALVARGRLFGEYYFKKKESDKMPGQKALTCVMRKLLKMFFGWYRSGGSFDRNRVFAMAGKADKAA